MLGRFAPHLTPPAQFIISKQNLCLRGHSRWVSQVLWYSCNSAPRRPHVGKDRSSQLFSKPDSQWQKLLNTRSGETWLELGLLFFSFFFLLPSQPCPLSSLSALSACPFYLFLMLFCQRRPLPLPHVNLSCQPELSGVLKCLLSWVGTWMGRESTKCPKQRKQTNYLPSTRSGAWRREAEKQNDQICPQRIKCLYISNWILGFAVSKFPWKYTQRELKQLSRTVPWTNSQSASAARSHVLGSFCVEYMLPL